MTVCCVKHCHSTTGKHNKCDNITFHTFPTDPAIADRWDKIIRRNRREEWWKSRKTTKICSKHFCEKDKYLTKQGLQRICRGAVPTKRLFLDSSESESENNENSEKPHSDNEVCVQKISTESYPDSHPSTSMGTMDQSSKVTIVVSDDDEKIISSDIAEETAKIIYKGFHNELDPSTSMGTMDQSSKVTTVVSDDDEKIISSDLSKETANILYERFHNELEPSTSMATMDQSSKVTTVFNDDHEKIISSECSDISEETAETLNESFHNEPEPIIDSSDLDYNLDIPRVLKLRRGLRRKTVLQNKNTKLIRNLKQKLRRLEKRNVLLQQTITSLKK